MMVHPFTRLLSCLLLSWMTVNAAGQDAVRLNDFIELNESVSAGTFGILIHDFSKATIEAERYRQLTSQLNDRDALRAFVAKLKQGQHVLGVAVYLNQRYPKKKLIPVSNGFPVANLTTIPLDLHVGGKKQTVHVSSVTFGKILHDHWELELDLIDQPEK